MFESYADRVDGRLLDIQPTEWRRIGRDGAEREAPIRERHEKPAELGIFQGICKVLGSIRSFAAEHEKLILIGVVLLIMLDCDDDVELLIALAILLYPYISDYFKKPGR